MVVVEETAYVCTGEVLLSAERVKTDLSRTRSSPDFSFDLAVELKEAASRIRPQEELQMSAVLEISPLDDVE